MSRRRSRLEALGDGRFRVSGVLDATTVGEVLEQSADALRAVARTSRSTWRGVAESDSAGLALLIEWLRLARQRVSEIRFDNVPAQIDALARISEVEDLLAARAEGRPSRTPTRQAG